MTTHSVTYLRRDGVAHCHPCLRKLVQEETIKKIARTRTIFHTMEAISKMEASDNLIFVSEKFKKLPLACEIFQIVLSFAKASKTNPLSSKHLQEGRRLSIAVAAAKCISGNFIVKPPRILFSPRIQFCIQFETNFCHCQRQCPGASSRLPRMMNVYVNKSSTLRLLQ